MFNERTNNPFTLNKLPLQEMKNTQQMLDEALKNVQKRKKSAQKFIEKIEQSNGAYNSSPEASP